MALEQGMSKDEIQKILSGNMEDITKDETVGVFYAQHYADKRGNSSEEAWQSVIEEYGIEKALGILGSVRVIMIGNIIGIPFSALINRFKGTLIKQSSFIYEIGMILISIVFIPIAFIHGLFSNLFRISII